MRVSKAPWVQIPLLPPELIVKTTRMSMKTYEDLFTPEAVAQMKKDGLTVPDKGNMTCNGCPQVGTCDLAWDLYNTNGDCLAMK
jgi:hypothetical protein